MVDRSGERWVAQLPSTAAIEDPQVRMFLDTLKNAWELRSGDSGALEDARFVTAGELEGGVTRALGRIFGGEAGGGGTGPGGGSGGGVGPSNRQIIDGIANSIVNSELYRRLTTRINNLEVPWDTINRINAAVAGMQAQISRAYSLLGFPGSFPNGITSYTSWANNTATSVNALSVTVGGNTSAIATLQTVTSTQATQISALQTTVGQNSSAITTLQQTTSTQATQITALQTSDSTQNSSILTLQNTTASQATSITNLQTTVNNQSTSISNLQTTVNGQATTISNIQSTLTSQGSSISTINSQIAELNNIAVTSSSAAAQNIFMIRSTLASGSGPIGRIYWQDDQPTGGTYVVGDRWVDTNSSPLYQLRYWNGSSWTTTVTSFQSYVDSGMTSEVTTRSTRDTALARAVNTMWAIMENGGTQLSSILEDGALAAAGAVSANASRWNSIQSAVIGPGGTNLVSQVRQDFDTYVNADNGRASSSYTVRVNANGNIAGFGIMAQYNPNSPGSGGSMGNPGNTTAFGVVADSFWIAAPGQASVGSGQVDASKVPFAAYTNYWYDENGKLQPPGVYIKRAVIANASVDTLRIAGSAVTVSTYNSSTVFNGPLDLVGIQQCSQNVVVSGLDSGETAGTIIVAFSTIYEQGGLPSTIIMEIFVNGTLNTQSAATFGESKTMTMTGFVALPNGTHTVTTRLRCDPNFAYPKNIITYGQLITMSGKR